MTVEALAGLVIDSCEQNDAEYMLTGSFAYGVYAIPRSTKDVDVVISLSKPKIIADVISYLETKGVEFIAQVQFDTLTWGQRHIGKLIDNPQLQVELFELFDDEFVTAQFERKVKLSAQILGRDLWVPQAEDIVIQKIRWGREKDLGDVIDILAVQEPENLDMEYIRQWAEIHGSISRLEDALAAIEGI